MESILAYVTTECLEETPILEFSKICCRCHCSRPRQDFIRIRGNNSHEFNSCNRCSKQRKSHLVNEKTSRKKKANVQETPDITGEEQHTPNEVESTLVTCKLDEVETLVRTNFNEARKINERVHFCFQVELSQELIGKIFENSLLLDKDRLRRLSEAVAVFVGNGSTYRWEIRDIYIGHKDSLPTGRGSVWLGCCQSDLRTWKPPANKQQQPRRRTVITRRAIQRFSCNGHMSLKFDIINRLISVTIRHDVQHIPPALVKPKSLSFYQNRRQFPIEEESQSGIIDRALIEKA